MFLQALIMLLAPCHSLFSDKNQNFLPACGPQEVEERGQFEIGGGEVSLSKTKSAPNEGSTQGARTQLRGEPGRKGQLLVESSCPVLRNKSDRSPLQSSAPFEPSLLFCTRTICLGPSGGKSGLEGRCVSSYLNVQFKFTTSTPCLASSPCPAIYVRHLFKQMTDSRFRSVQITLICRFNFCLRGARSAQSALSLFSIQLSPICFIRFNSRTNYPKDCAAEKKVMIYDDLPCTILDRAFQSRPASPLR